MATAECSAFQGRTDVGTLRDASDQPLTECYELANNAEPGASQLAGFSDACSGTGGNLTACEEMCNRYYAVKSGRFALCLANTNIKKCINTPQDDRPAACAPMLPPPASPRPPLAPPTVVVLSPAAFEPNQKHLFGIGDDWCKAKHRIDYEAVNDGLRALHMGSTRYPGGAISNYWSISNGSTVRDCDGAECLSKKQAAYDNGGQAGTCVVQQRLNRDFGQAAEESEPAKLALRSHFNMTSFGAHVVSLAVDARMPIIVFNLKSMNESELRHEIDFVANYSAAMAAAAAQAAGVPPNSEPLLLELGNEFYLPGMYDCKFGNESGYVYGTYAKQFLPQIRAAFPPSTRVAIVGNMENELLGPAGWDESSSSIERWHAGLNESGILPLVDAVTFHDYNLNPDTLDEYAQHDVELYASALMAMASEHMERTSEAFLPGGILHGKKAWVTEYGVLGKHYSNENKHPYLRQTRHRALRAFDTIGRIVYAVNHAWWVEALQYFNVGGGNFGESRMIDISDIVDGGGTDFKVNANGQVFAHVASRALRATHMAGVPTATDAPRLPMNRSAVGRTAPGRCVAAAAFRNTSSMTFVVLNRCAHSVHVAVDFSALAPAGANANASVFEYVGDESSFKGNDTLQDYGAWSSLPADPHTYPRAAA